jgi:hypothetical protein
MWLRDYLYLYIYMYIYGCLYLWYTYIFVYIHEYKCIHMYLYIYTYVNIQTYMLTNAHTYIHTYIHTYTYIYIFIRLTDGLKTISPWLTVCEIEGTTDEDIDSVYVTTEGQLTGDWGSEFAALLRWSTHIYINIHIFMYTYICI